MNSAAALPPGPRTPGALQMLQWVYRPFELMKGSRQRYGDVFTLHSLTGVPNVFLADPQHVKQVFGSDGESLRAGEANGIVKPLVGGNSVLLLDGERHRRE